MIARVFRPQEREKTIGARKNFKKFQKFQKFRHSGHQTDMAQWPPSHDSGTVVTSGPWRPHRSKFQAQGPPGTHPSGYTPLYKRPLPAPTSVPHRSWSPACRTALLRSKEPLSSSLRMIFKLHSRLFSSFSSNFDWIFPFLSRLVIYSSFS